MKITVIRHGSTKLNSANRIRGWADIPLDKNGIAEAHDTGEKLKDQPIDFLVSSDLSRAKDTADIISKHTGIPHNGPTKDFRPWNLGKFTGQNAEDVAKEMGKFVKNPDEKIPEGESFNEFRTRFLSAIKDLEKQHPSKHIGVVTHHRGDKLLEAWEKMGQPDNLDVHEETFMKKEGIDPAGFRVIDLNKFKKKAKLQKILNILNGKK